MRKILCVFCLLFFVLPLTCQVTGTGSYPFATFDNRGFDSINVGNLNVRFTIPIVSRTGRGTPFNYSLQYEGLVWSNVGGTWTPDPTWGMTGVLNGTAFAGYITHRRLTHACPRIGSHSGGNWFELTNYTYHDAFGALHKFEASYQSSCPNGGGGDDDWAGDGSAYDNSGYTLDMSDQSTVHTRSGTTITPAQSAAGQDTTAITDSNGNQITGDGSGSFTDTLGVTALTISGSSPRVFTYPVTRQANNATTASTTLSYQTYTVRTNFGCGGIVEYGSNTVSLPDRVTFADGSYYAFTYEPTLGTTSGEVTGRLASVRLPSGGVIAYSYNAGCGGNGGINGDSTVGGLVRTTSDGTRQYNRSPMNGNATLTDVIDEKGNDVRYFFTIDSATQRFFETHRQVHQGDINGTILQDQYTCYNGATTPCDGATIQLPISEADVRNSYNGGSQTLTKNTYDPNGTLLTGSVLSSGGNTLTSLGNSYDSQGNLTETINRAPDGVPYTDTYYRYDEGSVTATSGVPQHVAATGARGNLTSTHTSAGATYLTTSTTYYDTGQPATTTAQDGGVTTYSYDGTQGFVTGTSLPTPSSGVALSTSAQYDATSAALLSSTGMNAGETTTVNTYDGLMRPVNVSMPSGSVVTATYNQYEGLQHVMRQQTLDANRTATSEILLDAYGRLSRAGRYSGNSWYQVDYCYDSAGLLQFQSAAYQSTGFYGPNGPTPKHCSGSGVAYTYDALGRVTAVTNDDGTATTQYQGRAIKTTDVNGVAKITQYDLMGRVSAICELSGNALAGQSPADCGMEIAGTGFLTTYSYELVNHTTKIFQGSQFRVFVTDPAGRPTSTYEPERGDTAYSYNFGNLGLEVTRTRAKANQTDSNVKTSTVTLYDKLGRVIGVQYDDGITKNRYLDYDGPLTWMGWTNTPTNTKGRLTATSRESNTMSQYSYDVAGNVVDMLQCAPSICGGGNQQSRPPLHYTYDQSGAVMSAQDGASGNIAYTRSEAGEITSVTNQSYTDTVSTPDLVSNVVNGPFGVVSYHTGNGLNVYKDHDSLGRPTGNYVCQGPAAPNCAGEIYGQSNYWSGARVPGLCDTVLNTCQSNFYDDLNRLIAGNGSTSYAYAYDRWGNRTYANGASYGYDGSTNRQAGLAYDAAGNVTFDGVHSYTYDADGKVLQVDSGTTASYTYNALDQRVRVTTQAEDTEVLYDPFGRQQSSWNVSNNFGKLGRIYWEGQMLANRSWNGQTYFHHANYLGTERMRTNYQGQIAATLASGPYGENLQENFNDGWSMHDTSNYTGQEHDNVTGTDHFQFRQYQSTLGRWMSPDPYDGSYDASDPQSLNRYAYVGSNPIGATDPLGLQKSRSDIDDPRNDGGGGGLMRITSNSSFTGGFGASWNEFTSLNAMFSATTYVTKDRAVSASINFGDGSTLAGSRNEYSLHVVPGADYSFLLRSQSSTQLFAQQPTSPAPNNAPPQMMLIGQSNRTKGYCDAVNNRMIMNSCLYACETSNGNAATALFPGP